MKSFRMFLGVVVWTGELRSEATCLLPKHCMAWIVALAVAGVNSGCGGGYGNSSGSPGNSGLTASITNPITTLQAGATYAFQAYDAIKLIDSALKQTNGDTSNKGALRAALMKADFKSVRGNFKFNTNHYPIQDFYVVKAAKRTDGKYQTEIVEKVFSNYGDPYAADCPMK